MFLMVAVGHRHVLLVRKNRYVLETVTVRSHRLIVDLWSHPVLPRQLFVFSLSRPVRFSNPPRTKQVKTVSSRQDPLSLR